MAPRIMYEPRNGTSQLDADTARPESSQTEATSGRVQFGPILTRPITGIAGPKITQIKMETHKQASKQTNKQASKQANKPNGWMARCLRCLEPTYVAK